MSRKPGEPTLPGLTTRRPSPSRTARAMWVWAQRISDCVDSLRFLLDRLQRRHPDRAVGHHGLKPVDIIVGRRGVTEKHLIAKHRRRRHRAQPVEMHRVELRVGRPLPRTHLLHRPIDQPAIMIAEHMDGVERHQRIHGSPRFERAARHVAEIDDLANSFRADVGQHGLQREIVSMHIGDGGKTHANSPAFEQLWLYDRAKTMLGHLTHLGDTSQQHAPLVLWLEPGFQLAVGASLGLESQIPGLVSS